MRIVFLGTPDFAVATLRAIHEDKNFDIVGVVTAPDKPAGRGMQPRASAVKNYAAEQNMPVAQPDKLRNPEFIDWLKERNADLQVVVAFRMLPEVVWSMPRLGTYNVHASLLPQYRGAAPINWAIINGEKETGVTIFQLRHEIDTGPVLAKEAIPILPTDNAGTLHDKLMELGARTMVRVLHDLRNDQATAIPQDELTDALLLKRAPKIFTPTCQIDFSQPAEKVINHIRGLSPYPGAFTQFQQKIMKVFEANRCGVTNVLPGTVDSDGKSFLRMATSDEWICLRQIQMEGKKRMEIADFLRGLRL